MARFNARTRFGGLLLSAVVLTTAACDSSTPTPVGSDAASAAPPPSGSGAAIPTTSQSTTPSAATSATPTPIPTPVPPAQSTIEVRARSASDGRSIQLRGNLTAQGAGVAAARIVVSALPLDGRPQRVELTGIVPSFGVTGHVGLRMNIEGTEIGRSSVNLYEMTFVSDARPGNQVRNPRFRDAALHWGLHEDATYTFTRSDRGSGTMLRIRATKRQSAIVNTGGFAVRPGAEFRATALLKIPQSSVGTAYFTVIFLGKSTSYRYRLDLAPRPVTVSATTDAAGGFRKVVDRLTPGRYRVTVRFDGDAEHLPVRWDEVVTVG